MSVFDERMAVLRATFVRRARADHAALIEAEAQDDRALMRRIAHNLAGKGGLFGFPSLTDAARDLEDAIDQRLPADEMERFCRQLYGELTRLA